jgi:phosphoglycerol transferase MdoB-like AlkP superfamily enzyme
MRIAGIAGVLLVSRAAALAGHQIGWSAWSPIAYLWQDAALLLICAAIDRVLAPTPVLAWTASAIVVTYVAGSVPVIRVMSTPMTWTMWRAAGGALGDSIWHYVSAANVAWIAAALGASIASQIVASQKVAQDFSSASPRFAGLKACATAVALGIAALGPTAAAHVDTRGLDRNAWSALLVGALPRIHADASTTAAASDWRRGLAADARIEDLTRFRGAAADRNVFLVSLESTAAQYLSLYGAPDDVTPALSALARSAIVFDHAYASYPESIKGLLSMLCSIYPALDRAVQAHRDAPCHAIASHVAGIGYRTALFHSGRFGYLGMDAVVHRRGYQVLADAGDIGGSRESSFGVDDKATVARILTWIDSVPRGERFFLTYLPVSGHHPYEAPEAGPIAARDEFGRYRNALCYGDAAFADLVHGLESRGLDRSTVWIVVGDHGEAFGQHDGNFGHTFQLYDENVRVPFIVSIPGLVAQPIRAPQIVSLVDTAPTILDLLGLPADAAYQGTSVLAPGSRMALFFTDYSLGLLGLRDGRLKYVYNLDSTRSQLFDLDVDPAEAHDIAAEHSAAARWYAARLRSWIAAQQASVAQ